MSEFNIGLDDSRDGKIAIRRGKKVLVLVVRVATVTGEERGEKQSSYGYIPGRYKIKTKQERLTEVEPRDA